MMTFISVVLTIALVFDCLLLMLLVLIQLPKKEAGAGLAFGGGASDALFGAGAGNTLTKITKWTAGIFFGLALVLSVLNTYAARTGNELRNAVSRPANTAPGNPLNVPGTPPVAPPSKPAVSPTNAEMPMTSTTNTPAVPVFGTNTTTNIPIIPPK
jgi:preprotein translocase subunit SecG